MTERNRRAQLEEVFDLAEDYLQPPLSSEFRPGLILATVKGNKEDRLLKIWWKTGTGTDAEFRELWGHERLQVRRIMNYPDADEVMVGIVDMIETSDAFCVVYEAGPTPLSSRIRKLPKSHWLHALEVIPYRTVLWQNLARLAKALGIIHAQGLIHGAINQNAVFTEGSKSADFKLGGFEWSVALSDAEPLDALAAQARARLNRLIYSYADDWRALGSMFASLLGLDPTKLRNDDPFQSGARVIDLSDAEIEFLRRLVDPSREDAYDPRSLHRDIDTLTRELSRHHTNHSARFILLARLNDKMREAINTVTESTIGLDESLEQISYIEADVASGAKLVVSERDNPEELDSLTLITESLSYRLRPFADEGPTTWQIATVISIQPRTDVRLPHDREIYELPHAVIVTRNKAEALEALNRLSGQAIEWIVPVAPKVPITADPESTSLFGAVLLIQFLEALLKAMNVLPVTVTRREVVRGRTIVRIVAMAGNARDALATQISERSTADLLERLFEKDELGIDLDWQLSTSGALSSRQSKDVRVRFIEPARGHDGTPSYDFEAWDVLTEENNVFLRVSGDIGTEVLIRRRLRTTRALRDQGDLVAMFVDPRRRLRPSNDVLTRDAAFQELDIPKRNALEVIWTTTPTQLVVGPPGVGKTRLSAEIVRRKLETEPTSRILLSAQSHQALDNLLSTVRQTVVSSSNDAIIVRSRGTDEAASTAEDVRKTALSYLHRLHKSDLARSAPKLLRDNLQALTYAVQQAAEDVDHEALSPVGQREQAGFRALEALVLESANVVFSTSNSMDVERLSEDGAQFDWVIIEEAAKASGPDLIAPLSLSGRRLLIGDHYQLPPFDAERLRAILTNKTAIRAALNETGVLLGTTFFESGLEELQTEALDEANLDQICHLGLRALEPFRTLVEEDEKRRSIAGGQRRSVTSELLCQHRMDPAIARLVSRCFYHDRLETSDERVEQAREPLPFSFGDTFPTAPIVFVDMPLVSRSGKAEPIEFDRPRWHNPTERRVVSNLLDQLRGTSEEAPSTSRTLGILSPYRAQVERLKSKVDSLQAKQEFSWFRPFTHDGRFLATVDSSQGSEAALVLISLVRNSHKTGVAGLGFLRDPRRMNVLLSRAKLQLILIGSLEFLRESTRFTTPHAEFDLSFIRVFLETLDLLRNEIGLRGGPCAAVVDGTSWMES